MRISTLGTLVIVVNILFLFLVFFSFHNDTKQITNDLSSGNHIASTNLDKYLVVERPANEETIPVDETRFEKKLKQYIKSYKQLKGAVVVECVKGELCGGLGDRIKLILTGATIALLTNRILIININKDFNLEDYYQPNLIEWRPSQWDTYITKEKNAVLSLINKSCDRLIYDISKESINKNGNENILILRTNMDCLSLLIRSDVYVERARAYGVLEENMWQSKIFKALFKPTQMLKDAIVSLVGSDQRYPTYGLHMRIGGPYINDLVRLEFSKVEETIRDYVKCAEMIKSSIDNSTNRTTMFVAGDNATTISKLKKHLSRFWDVITSENIGSIGHVEKHHTDESDIRMFVDFEILRRTRYLIVAPSGFSIIAYNVREMDNTIAVSVSNDPMQSCRYIYINFGIQASA